MNIVKTALAASAAAMFLLAACAGTAGKTPKSGAAGSETPVEAVDNGCGACKADAPPDSGSPQDTITVNTAKELAGLAEMVSNDKHGFKGKTVILGRDIVINDTANWREWGSNPPAVNWTVIGTDGDCACKAGTDKSRFHGTFDGNGHTISGLYIKNKGDDQGLFGVIGGKGAVKNLNIKAAYIDGGDYVGILAGGSAGTVTECYAYGIVMGDSIAGGLVGVNEGTVKNSYAAGSVTGRVNVGGLVGGNRAGAAIGSHSSAEVFGDSVAGGFIGVNWGGMTAGNFSTGKVTARVGAGGFAGRSGGGVMRGNYYDKNASGQSDAGKGEGKTTAQMQSGKFVNSLNSFAGLASANLWARSKKGYPVLSGKAAALTDIGQFFAGGKGSADAPYIIRTKKQMEEFSDLVNLGVDFTGKHIKLARNIVLNDTANWRNWASEPPASVWVPAGILANSFNGTFDGGGHTVSGVYVNSPEALSIGLFGSISAGAVIKNIGVTASYISGWCAAGGLVGVNGGGLITDSYSTATVAGTGCNTGGLVGVSSGIINRCYAAGAVSGGLRIGGLVGEHRTNGVISNSYSTGTVAGDSIVGGLVGIQRSKTQIKNSYTLSAVSGGDYAGGLMGWYIGCCSSSDCNGEVNSSFFVRRAGGIKSGCYDEFGIDAELLKQPQTLSGWGLGRVWDIDSAVNGGYPYLLDQSSALSKAAWEKHRKATDWYTKGGGREFFSISEAEELSALSAIVNGALVDDGIPKDDFSGKTIKLAGNIDLSQYDNWTPIGTFDKYCGGIRNEFRGTFDGGGYVISNLTVNREKSRNNGLFGYIAGGSVKNLGVENVNIRAGEVAGGIAGYISGSAAIVNCYTAGKIDGKEIAGGIAGYVDENSGITNCYSTAAVSASDGSVGGLAGMVNRGFVSNSYSAGSVSGKSKGIGGLVGMVEFGVAITGSYSIAAVSGTENMADGIGGLIGRTKALYVASKFEGRVSDCAALSPEISGGRRIRMGRVAGFIENSSGETIYSNNVAFAGMKNGNGNTGWPNRNAGSKNGADITFADIMADSTIGGRFTEENGWTLSKGKLPGLRGKAVEVPKYIRGLSVILPEYAAAAKGGERQFNAVIGGKAGNDAVRWTVSGSTSKSTVISDDGKLTAGADESAKFITVHAKSKTDSTLSPVAYVLINEVPDTRWYSKNPEAKNFTISTANELMGLAEIVNGTWGGKPARDSFGGKTIKMSKDIYLSQDDSWVPIGNYGADTLNVFSGTFNGGGFAIHNLAVNSAGDEVKDGYPRRLEIYGHPVYSKYIGLFGRIVRGRVENLGLAGVNVVGSERVGGIAGEISDGSSVVSCYTAGVIGGPDDYEFSHYDNGIFVGGIVGMVYKNSAVASSYSTCKVTGASYVGGIAGHVGDSSSISVCYSTGDIGNDYNSVGGIAGVITTNSSVTGCYFTGSISGGGGVAAGVFGSSRIANSAALYSMKKGPSLWRVAARASESSTFENNAAYYIEIEDKYRVTRVPAKEKGADTRYGADITAARIKADGTIGGRFTAKNGWTVKNGRLPGLGGKTVEIPKHLQADIPEMDRLRMRLPESAWSYLTEAGVDGRDGRDDGDYDDDDYEHDCYH